jgi:hypothetical protein
MVQLIGGTNMPPQVHDGCSVDNMKTGGSASLVILTIQNFGWESEDAEPPYFNLTFHLPDLRLVRREPVQEVALQNAQNPELSLKQRVFLDKLGKGPFASQAIMWSSDGKVAIFAEINASISAPFLFVTPRMTIGLPNDMSVSGRFAVYDTDAKAAIARYEIPGLRTDLFGKTLLAPDGSFVFHCHNNKEGQRKLFLVKISPKPVVVDIAYGELDPWWIAGVLVPSEK